MPNRGVLDVSCLLGLNTGIIVLDQENAFDRELNMGTCEKFWRSLGLTLVS